MRLVLLDAQTKFKHESPSKTSFYFNLVLSFHVHTWWEIVEFIISLWEQAATQSKSWTPFSGRCTVHIWAAVSIRIWTTTEGAFSIIRSALVVFCEFHQFDPPGLKGAVFPGGSAVSWVRVRATDPIGFRTATRKPAVGLVRSTLTSLVLGQWDQLGFLGKNLKTSCQCHQEKDNCNEFHLWMSNFHPELTLYHLVFHLRVTEIR